MKKEILDSLYSARWAISRAINGGEFDKLDFASDAIAQAKADYITQDVEPDRPDEEPNVQEIQTKPIRFNHINGVSYSSHGSFSTLSGLPRGVVIHYTVSDREERNAKGVVKYLAGKGLGAVVMDENGELYVPSGFDPMSMVVWHAGKSEWKGVSGISRYCVGLEVCCWGRLDGTPRLEKLLTEKQFFKNQENIVQGTYEMFTPRQMIGIRNFIDYVKSNSPDFDHEWVVGHDEICVPKGRKQDPGGALGGPMQDFRESLRL